MQGSLNTYCFDLDKTICFQEIDKDYERSFPDNDIIKKINYLYDQGHRIIIYTARGMTRFDGDIDKIIFNYKSMTEEHLNSWGLKFHKLLFGKPSYDFFIDDKSILIQDFKKIILPKRGVIAGMFDIIHPGYIHMFETTKNFCDFLVVCLHDDPKIERVNKKSPILSIEERKYILKSIKFIDDIVVYKTEKDFIEILKNENFDIRFLGDDYRKSNFTGSELNIPIQYIERSHGWSSTKFKKLISDDEKN
jgi:glycerol-3-phosphate cytidylyltransferase